MQTIVFWTFLFLHYYFQPRAGKLKRCLRYSFYGLPSNQTVATQTPRTQTGKLNDKTREALLADLADERRAQATYETVVAKFSDVRPFSNIVNAEKRHESFLLPLFEKYRVEVPKNEFSKDKVKVPATVAETSQKASRVKKKILRCMTVFWNLSKKQISERFLLICGTLQKTITCQRLKDALKVAVEEWKTGAAEAEVYKRKEKR
jgi:rubrerythrin